MASTPLLKMFRQAVLVGRANMLPRLRIPSLANRHFVLAAWQPLVALVLTVALGVVSLSIGTGSTYNKSNLVCNANGEVEEVADDWSPLWNIQMFFTINIPVLSPLSFTQAKIVDACWDFVFGRGGQALAGMMAYRVLRHSIQLSMEKSLIPIPTATSICCQQGIEFMSVWEISRTTIAHTRGLPPRTLWKSTAILRYAACSYVCIYVLSFATIASVTTGYFSEVDGFYGEQRLKVTDMTRPEYLLLDGDSIGVRLPTALADGDQPSTSEDMWYVLVKYWETCSRPKAQYQQNYAFISDDGRFKNDKGDDVFSDGSSNYTWICPSSVCSCELPSGSSRLAQLNSNLTIGGVKYSIGAPPLDLRHRLATDIAQHRVSFWDMNGTVWKNDSWLNVTGAILDVKYDDIRDNSVCIPRKEYSWGFSVQLLLTFVVYSLLFSVSLTALHAEAYWHSRLYRLDQPRSIYSDILAIADSLTIKFGSNIRELTNRDLDKRVSTHEGGMRLEVGGLPPSRKEIRRIQRLRYDLDAGNEEAGEELVVLQRSLQHRETGHSGLPTNIEAAEQTALIGQLRFRPDYGDPENRAESPLPGLETEISSIHSRYTTGEGILLSSADTIER